MSEKGSPFINILAALIFHSAKEKGMEEEVAEGLVAAHQLNDAGGRHEPLRVMKPRVRKLVEHEVDGADGAVESLGLTGIGHVRLKDRRAGPAVQSLAERVDHHVSERKRRTNRVTRARQVLQEIQDEIIKKNGW